MENINICIIDNNEYKEWDKFIDSSDGGTIFHKTLWLKAAKEETKTNLIRIIAYYNKDIYLALPIFIKKIMGVKFGFSPPRRCLIPCMGIVLANEIAKQEILEKKYFKIMDKINKFIKKELKTDYINIVNSVEIEDMRPFTWAKYKITPLYTYYININRDENEIFRNFNPKTRNVIHRASKYNDLQINNGDRNSYLRIIQNVRKRYDEQGLLLPGSDKYFEKLYDELYQKNQIIIKEARNSDHSVTGFVILKYKNKIHHWIGGTTPKGNYSGINELIQWIIIKENNNKYTDYYDLIGANTPHLCRYKRKYGVTLKQYFKVEKGNIKGNLIKRIHTEILNKKK